MRARTATVPGILDYDDLIADKREGFFKLFKEAGYDKSEYCDGDASEFCFEEDTLQITGLFTPGDPGCQFLPNGDPGYPSDAGEVDDIIVTLKGRDITDYLTSKYTQKYFLPISEQAIEDNDR